MRPGSMRLALLPATDEAAPAPAASLADQAYEQIKADLFDLQLLPGDFFTETGLAARLGLSRTPLRQALQRLQREGHILVHQRAGWQVRPFDPDRFDALYDLRIVLELAAVERLCARTGNQGDDILAEQVALWLGPAACAGIDPADVARLDEQFHCALLQAAGNPEMARAHFEVTEKIRIIRKLDFTKPRRIEATVSEHAAILRMILSRRAAEAAWLLKSHIGTSKAEVRQITLDRLYRARPVQGPL